MALVHGLYHTNQPLWHKPPPPPTSSSCVPCVVRNGAIPKLPRWRKVAGVGEAKVFHFSSRLVRLAKFIKGT